MAGRVAGRVAPAVVVEGLAVVVAGQAVAQVAEPAGAVAWVDWGSSAVEERWSAVEVGRKAVVVDWNAACCFPDAVGDPVEVGGLHFAHRAYCGVEHLDAVEVFADRVAQRHWPAELVALDAPVPVELAGWHRIVAAAEYSEVVHGAFAAGCAFVG